MSKLTGQLRLLKEDTSTLAVFSDVVEWVNYKNDVIDMQWTSSLPSKTLPHDEREKEEDKGWTEYKWAEEDEQIHEKMLVYAYLNGMDDVFGLEEEESDENPYYFEQPQNAHNAEKLRRQIRRAQSIKAKTKFIKLCISDCVRRFKSWGKLANRYEGWFFYGGRFIKYDPTLKESNALLEEVPAEEAPAENSVTRKKYYDPKVLLEDAKVLKDEQAESEQHSSAHKKNVCHLPKKNMRFKGSFSGKLHRTNASVRNAFPYDNQLPNIVFKPILLRHFIGV